MKYLPDCLRKFRRNRKPDPILYCDCPGHHEDPIIIGPLVLYDENRAEIYKPVCRSTVVSNRNFSRGRTTKLRHITREEAIKRYRNGELVQSDGTTGWHQLTP
ncbi:hypothetical protein ACFLQN_04075 [Candidatus Aenigmatarchaeota archaeon]